MGSAQNIKDEKRDKARGKSIFKELPGKSGDGHGVRLLESLNPFYIASLLALILKAGASPTFSSSKDGNAIRINIYWSGEIQQGKWASNRDDFDNMFGQIEDWLIDVNPVYMIRKARWNDEMNTAIFEGNE